MPRYINLPTETIELVDPANDWRIKRQSNRFEAGGGPCVNCGHINRQILEDDPPYTMIRWLEQFILNDAKLRVKTDEKNGREQQTPEGRKSMRLIAAIRKAFRGKNPGDEVVIDEPHWERIKEILEHPGNVWNMSQMAQFDAFFEAWYNATDTSRTKKQAAAIPVLEEVEVAEARA